MQNTRERRVVPIEVPEGSRAINLHDYRDSVTGAWFGQNIGALLGLPFKGRSAAAEPLTNYVEWKDPANPAAGLKPLQPTAAACNDDTYCELVALRALERFGALLTPRQLGEQWMADGAGFAGASQAARQAMLAGHWPPASGHPQLNPHYNAIGAQTSSAIYGMIAPGHLNCAAATARRLNHVNGYAEGSDGGAIFAAMVSEAMFEPDIRRVVGRALGVLDPRAPTRVACEEILAFRDRKLPWREAATASQQRWKPIYPRMDNAVANAALAVLGLVYGESDFLKTVSIVCQAADGADTDGNAGVAGAVVGAQRKLRRIPARLLQPLNDRYRVQPRPGEADVTVAARDEVLSNIALRITIQGSRFVIAHAGARREENFLIIPNPDPVPQPLESWPETDAPAPAAERNLCGNGR